MTEAPLRGGWRPGNPRRANDDAAVTNSPRIGQIASQTRREGADVFESNAAGIPIAVQDLALSEGSNNLIGTVHGVGNGAAIREEVRSSRAIASAEVLQSRSDGISKCAQAAIRFSHRSGDGSPIVYCVPAALRRKSSPGAQVSHGSGRAPLEGLVVPRRNITAPNDIAEIVDAIRSGIVTPEISEVVDCQVGNRRIRTGIAATAELARLILRRRVIVVASRPVEFSHRAAARSRRWITGGG